MSGAVAGRYSPITGLLTGRSTPGAGGGLGGAYAPVSLSSGSANLSGLGGAAGYGLLNPQTNTDAGTPGTPTAASSISGIGAYTPDWNKLIQGDPGLLNEMATENAGSASDIASRNAQIQRAIIGYGQLPDLNTLARSLGLSANDVASALGPDVAKLAQENTDAGTSQVAQLNQANSDALRSVTNQLNARGILNSGETGFQLDRQSQADRQNRYGATQKLLDALSQYQQGYLTAQQARQQQLAQAYSDAANRAYQNNQGSSGFTAVLDHTDSQGHAVYRGPDGNYYNADGSRYSAPQAPTPPPPTAPPPPPAPAPVTTYSAPSGGKAITGPSIFSFK